jgi:NADH-quinone oxidoreductase subunit C/D
MLYDLTAIDERVRTHRDGQPESSFTVVYHLLSFDRNQYLRVKVPLSADRLSLPTITGIFPAANWYEREAWDMFGVVFEGHPHLARILMPPTWEGHPLRKDHPARGTEIGPYHLDEQKRYSSNPRNGACSAPRRGPTSSS